MTTYYFDTCIWRDHYENRFGPQGRPLGDYATRLFMHLIKNKDVLLFSYLTVKELKTAFDEKNLEEMMKILTLLKILKKVETTKDESIEAEKIARERNLSPADVFHALVARHNKAILVSQDKHFEQLKDIAEVKKPEEII